jgi:hypothetical protein
LRPQAATIIAPSRRGFGTFLRAAAPEFDMSDESRIFGLSMALTLGGLVVLLYGVKLDSGMSTNLPMILGGAVIVVAIAILSYGVMDLDAPEGGPEH